LDDVGRRAVDVTSLDVALAIEHSGSERGRELLDERRIEAVLKEDVGGWKRSLHDRVVRRVEARGEATALTGGSVVDANGLVRVADVVVRADLRLVVAPGIVTVCRVPDVISVAIQVVGHREPRYEAVGVDADEPARRLALHVLVANTKIRRHMI